MCERHVCRVLAMICIGGTISATMFDSIGHGMPDQIDYKSIGASTAAFGNALASEIAAIFERGPSGARR